MSPLPARALPIVFLVSVLLLGAGVAACTDEATDANRQDAAQNTAPAPVTARRLAAPATDTFDIADGTATLACQGSGPVPVVLVAGTDDPIDRWDALVDDLGQEVLACRFAPPSGPDLAPATPARRADALSEVLDASELPGPYVLVAHSLGGLTVRRFGDRHADQLGAALFLDATTPAAVLSLHAELSTNGWDPDATQADADAPVSWPDVPVTVFAHDPAGEPLGLGPDVEELWTEGQQAYVTLTDDARFEQVEGTGHHIDLDATRYVTKEIDRLIERTSEGQR